MYSDDTLSQVLAPHVDTGFVRGPWNAKKIQSSCINFILTNQIQFPDKFITHIIHNASKKYSVPYSTLWNWHDMYRKYYELPCETWEAFAAMKRKAGFSCKVHGNTKWSRRLLLNLKKILNDKPCFFRRVC